MKLRDNILLTHISDTGWLGEAAMLGAALISKTVGWVSFMPDLLINQSLGQGTVYNRKIAESKRWPKAKSLGWTLVFPDAIIDAIRTGKVGNSAILISHSVWYYQVCATRSVYHDLLKSTGSSFVVSSNHKGLGGVSRQVHSLLQSEVYQPLKIAMPAYDDRNEYWQCIDLIFGIAYAQYLNWANGLVHSEQNILGAFMLANGYNSDYLVRVDRWKSIDDISPIAPKLQGSKIVSISSENATKNFKWSELMHSNYAKANRMSNVANAQERRNLLELAQLLQVIRDWYGEPMTLNSGFRSEKVNEAVGGVANSAHRHGFAVDVVFSSVAKDASSQLAFARKIGTYLRSQGIKFDQIISYGTFIHVGVRKPSGAQRCEVFHTNRYASTVRYYK